MGPCDQKASAFWHSSCNGRRPLPRISRTPALPRVSRVLAARGFLDLCAGKEGPTSPAPAPGLATVPLRDASRRARAARMTRPTSRRPSRVTRGPMHSPPDDSTSVRKPHVCVRFHCARDMRQHRHRRARAPGPGPVLVHSARSAQCVVRTELAHVRAPGLAIISIATGASSRESASPRPERAIRSQTHHAALR